MRALTLIATIAAIAGLLLVGYGALYPVQFRLDAASAPQVAQVYSQAVYWLAFGGALLALAAVCLAARRAA